MRRLVLALAAGASLQGCCAPGPRAKWNCVVDPDDITEVCVKRICRDLHSGKFMECP